MQLIKSFSQNFFVWLYFRQLNGRIRRPDTSPDRQCGAFPSSPSWCPLPRARRCCNTFLRTSASRAHVYPRFVFALWSAADTSWPTLSRQLTLRCWSSRMLRIAWEQRKEKYNTRTYRAPHPPSPSLCPLCVVSPVSVRGLRLCYFPREPPPPHTDDTLEGMAGRVRLV